MSDDKNKPFGTPLFDQRVTSYGQKGGITAHTVNMGPPKRSLDTPEAAVLKKELLGFDRSQECKISVVMSDPEALSLAQQISDFMLSNGFTVNGINQVMFGKPVVGLHRNENELIIGHRG